MNSDVRIDNVNPYVRFYNPEEITNPVEELKSAEEGTAGHVVSTTHAVGIATLSRCSRCEEQRELQYFKNGICSICQADDNDGKDMCWSLCMAAILAAEIFGIVKLIQWGQSQQ